MSNKISIKYEDYRVWVMGLVISCPYDVEACNCPLKEARGLSLQERVNFVDGMSEQALVSVVDYHIACFDKRSSDI